MTITTTMAETVTETINRFLASGDWPHPYAINCGQCEDFAMDVIDAITGERENEALYMIWVEDQQHPQYEHICHAVICMDTPSGYMYFDSECPAGVDNLGNIPAVKNNPETMVMTITPINSITIPSKYVDACDGWYSGIGDLLYAVCSTGGLTTGTNRPAGCNTDEQWYLNLWRQLSIDIMYARQASAEADFCEGGEDHPVLSEFENWVDDICERLAEEYNLEEWERII